MAGTGRHLSDVNFFLETLNGATSILLAVAIIFLSFYLLDQRRLQSLKWWEMIVTPSPGIALALPMVVIKLGLLLTRGSLWIWRQFSDGGAMPMWQRDLALTGAVLTSIGLLWLLRVMSRARFGDWPWIISAMLVMIYVVANSIEQSLS